MGMCSRFKNAEALLRHLHGTGLDPQARLAPPSTLLNGECGDPGCCAQWSGNPGDFRDVITEISNTQLHKLCMQLVQRKDADVFPG